MRSSERRLMRAPDAGALVNELRYPSSTVATKRVLAKVCGVTTAEDAILACSAGADLIGVINVPKSKRCVDGNQASDIVDAVRAFGEREQGGLRHPMAHWMSGPMPCERLPIEDDRWSSAWSRTSRWPTSRSSWRSRVWTSFSCTVPRISSTRNHCKCRTRASCTPSRRRTSRHLPRI